VKVGRTARARVAQAFRPAFSARAAAGLKSYATGGTFTTMVWTPPGSDAA
jgi:hypothetical protein